MSQLTQLQLGIGESMTDKLERS